MGFRFQRRIRLAAGLRLNVSKSGVGVSVGARGASVSVGRRGIYRNIGIPGTGLSHRARLDTTGSKGKGRSNLHKGLSAPSATFVEQLLEDGRLHVSIRVLDSGEIELLFPDGTPLKPDEAATVRKRLGDTLRADVAAHCDRLNQGLDDLGGVHQQTPAPADRPIFIYGTFDVPAPKRFPDIAPSLWQRMWPPARRRVEDENTRRGEEYHAAFRGWEAERRRFQRQEVLRREIETVEVFRSPQAVSGVLSYHLERIPWPKPTDIDFDLDPDQRMIAIDIDLPTEEEMPAARWSMPAKQLRVTERRLSDTKRRELYMGYVHGVAFRVLGEVFARLPTVQCALVSGYTQRVDRGSGNEADSYLYSVMVPRRAWARIDFGALHKVDPIATLDAFTLRRNMTKTGIFRPIEPFEMDDLARTCR